MHDAPVPPAGRYIPFKQEGWGIALFIVLLAIGSAVTAAYVHTTAHKSPNDLRFRAAGSASPAASH